MSALLGMAVGGGLGLFQYMNELEREEDDRAIAQATAAGIGFHGQRPAAVKPASLWDTFGGGLLSGALAGYYLKDAFTGEDVFIPEGEDPANYGTFREGPTIENADMYDALEDNGGPSVAAAGQYQGTAYQPHSGYTSAPRPLMFEGVNDQPWSEGLGFEPGPPGHSLPPSDIPQNRGEWYNMEQNPGPGMFQKNPQPGPGMYTMPSQQELYQQDNQSGYFTEPYRAKKGY